MWYRQGEKADLPELVDLVKRAVKDLEQQNIFQWDEVYPNEEVLRRDLERQELFAGIEQGCIRVFYVLNRECSPEYENGNWKYPDVSYYIIHRLCVDPDFQGQGLGKKAMEHMESQVRALGVGAVRLDAFLKNAYAVNFYERLGYKIVGYARWRKGRFCLMEKYLGNPGTEVDR